MPSLWTSGEGLLPLLCQNLFLTPLQHSPNCMCCTRAHAHTHTHNLHCHCHKSTCCIRSLQSESCGVRAGLVLSLIERMVCPCHWRAGVLWVVNEVGVHPWRLCVHANPTFATAWAGQRTPMQLAWMSRKSLAEVKPCSV